MAPQTTSPALYMNIVDHAVSEEHHVAMSWVRVDTVSRVLDDHKLMNYHSQCIGDRRDNAGIHKEV